jgi:tRNA threonylcarbamoyladenosine biosynthesis protein TsaB
VNFFSYPRFTPPDILVKLPLMIMLAIETATMTGGIAVVRDNLLVGEARINVKIAHSERLMNAVEWLLKTVRLSVKDVDAFAVSIGPGSFTGLRIGLSTAKGLAYASDRPLIPVPTLDALARALPFCSLPICPMLDARKNEIYTGLYRWEGGTCIKLISETAVNPADFLREMRGLTLFTGDGAVLYRDMIQDILKEKALFATPAAIVPSAASVAEIALEKFRSGAVTDPVTVIPMYIRKSEAEIHWKA